MALRRVDGIPLPADGRSSAESGGGVSSITAMNAIGSVTAPFDLNLLARLKQLWLFNPDTSQFVGNITHMGNTGHAITIDAATDATAEAALGRVNETAQRIYPNGAGVDGLLNAYFAQMAVFGAISSEDVVDFAGRRVAQTVLVPVEQIRFRFLDGRYVPHQMPGILGALTRRQAAPLGLIELNENTYKYYAHQTVQNSPYAKPPALAAVEILEGPQTDAIDNIKWIVKKLGILGLVAVSVAAPKPKPGESDGEFLTRAETYLKRVKDALSGGFARGLLVTFRDQKVDHANVVSDARGSKEIFQVIEEQAFSGFNMPPAFFGRVFSTTETFASVLYNLLVAQTDNFRRLAKRRQEQTYRLDLALAGIAIDRVTLAFNRMEAIDDYRKAQGEQIRQTMALERAIKGITSPDQCAQEIGYEAAFDPELLSSQPAVAKTLSARRLSGLTREGVSATFRFDRQAQRYRFQSSVIEIASEPVEAANENVREFKKKAAA